MMTELTDFSLAGAIRALRAGEVSSSELTRAYLDRIERLEPSLHAFVTLTPELALAQAQDADDRLYAWRKDPDSPLPALLGVPLAVKDLLCVAGVRCTAGSRILENYVPPFDASVIEMLLAAGVVILGKTNTDEFAMGSSTENSAYGVTHNPWELLRVPGGSSGGSAAAVSAQLAPAALGTDTGGSVRQPAAFCNLTGIKPTYGRVSRYGLIAYGSSLDVVGVLGKDAIDVAVIFHQIAGFDSRDATTLDMPVPKFRLGEYTNLAGLRIGVPDEYFIPGMQSEVEVSIKRALGVFDSLGAVVETVSLPHTEYALPVYYLIATAEASANLARYDGIRYGPRQTAGEMRDVYLRTRGAMFGSEVKRRIMLGTYALSAGYYDAYYGQAYKVRTLIKRDFERVFRSVDLIAAPVSPTTAFKIGQHSDDPLSMYLEDVYTLPANLSGVPGLAFPVGFDRQDLPVGMQLIAPHFQEQDLFRTVHVYQRVTDWHSRKPPL